MRVEWAPSDTSEKVWGGGWGGRGGQLGLIRWQEEVVNFTFSRGSGEPNFGDVV